MTNPATVPLAHMLGLILVGLALAGPVGASSHPSAGTAVVESGHSAHWYNTARSGEGWVLEILPEDRALIYWFTYDEDGNQRWLIGLGNIIRGESGDSIEFPEMYVTRGARFGPGFDPEDVEREDVGVAAMTFDDCDHGTFSFQAFGQSQTIEVVRLTQTMAAGCEPIHGTPGLPAKEYAGETGSWYDPAHDGEGYSLQWLSRDEAVLTWYSYDSEGNQYWMIGTGHRDKGRIVFPDLKATRGARFGDDFDPEDVERFDWGSLVLELDCNGGSAQYDSELAPFGSGDFDLTRLSRLERPDCPWERPKFTDLYEIAWKEIPIAERAPDAPGDRLDSNNIQAQSIADDGTVVAARGGDPTFDGWRLALWRPGADEWDVLAHRINRTPVVIAPDAIWVAADQGHSERDEPISPLRWSLEEGWRQLPSRVLDRSWIYTASQDLKSIAGKGHDFGEAGRDAWVWTEEQGQWILPFTETIPGGSPTAVSNDGNRVFGWTLWPPDEGSSIPTRAAIQWLNGKDPELMLDGQGAALGVSYTCDPDCNLVFGAGQARYDPDHPHVGEAWFRMASGEVRYLGTLPDGVRSRASYGVNDVTQDGTLAVGSYTAVIESTTRPDQLTGRGFIWTQRTGMVSVRSLVKELGIGDDHWRTMGAVGVSSSGDKILLSGWWQIPFEPSDQNRAVILELKPKGG